LRQMLRNLHSRHIGVDRLELPAEAIGSIGFQIERVEMRGAAAEINKDPLLCGVLANLVGCRQTQVARERQPQSSENADLERVAPSRSIAVSVNRHVRCPWHVNG